ncbi:hypothetical protein [Streptomyces sp. NBC_01481]|uniref:hypothetical protein n=1 Tax=Streptomyces sp. NBC_01481 TaxID=2975869 RepID=UPI00225AE662|nr:hypothetical protein [Streptomyces sp. NBC_01481]MCX4586323.1 hypothetical protein [Streptomyces sp. NBC_01481]
MIQTPRSAAACSAAINKADPTHSPRCPSRTTVDLGRAAGSQDLMVRGICQQDHLHHAHHFTHRLGDQDDYLGIGRKHLREVPAHCLDVGHAIDGRVELDMPFSIRETQADKRGHIVPFGGPDQDRHNPEPSSLPNQPQGTGTNSGQGERCLMRH